jgi:hypothetical protein
LVRLLAIHFALSFRGWRKYKHFGEAGLNKQMRKIMGYCSISELKVDAGSWVEAGLVTADF